MAELVVSFGNHFEEHEVIRAGIKQLADHLGDKFWQTAEEREKELDAPETRPMRDSTLRNLRWGLFYFLDGLKNHFDRDEEVVMPHVTAPQKAELQRDHDAIRETLERAVSLVNRIVDGKLTGSDFERGCTELSHAVHHLQDLLEEHTREEDAILRTVGAGNGGHT